MGNLRRLGRLFVLIGAIAASAGAAKADTLRPITILVPSAPSVPAFAPLVLAQHLGFYGDVGFVVKLLAAKGGVDVAKQVGVGNAELGTAIGDTAIIVRANGIPVKIVGLLGGGSLTTIVARPDRGVRTLADLRGKKVSVLAFQDTTYFGLLGALAAIGLGKSDVAAEAMGPAGVTSMVLTGDVDACACVPEREVDIQNALPGAVSFPVTDYFPSMAQAIIASDDTIARQPEIVRGVVAATLRAIQFVIDDPARAAAAYVAASPAFEGKQALIQQIMERYIERAYKGPGRLGEVDPARLAALQDFYVKQGIVRDASPIADLYTNALVPSPTAQR